MISLGRWIHVSMVSKSMQVPASPHSFFLKLNSVASHRTFLALGHTLIQFLFRFVMRVVALRLGIHVICTVPGYRFYLHCDWVYVLSALWLGIRVNCFVQLQFVHELLALQVMSAHQLKLVLPCLLILFIFHLPSYLFAFWEPEKQCIYLVWPK